MVKTIEELVNEPWRKKIKWDVTHAEALRRVEDKTFCFDPLLSYESTGYRPINETMGLDFDPTPFKKAGLDRIKSGTYTGLQPGGKKHRDWWREEYDKCENGMVHNNYRVNGDHYFFLNFYMMQSVEIGQKAGAGRNFTHPKFWNVHYEWFHYIELAEILGFDAAGLKGRGVGFSEIGACLCVRPYITTPNYNTMYVASYEPFLIGKGIIQKCWVQLDWLNQNSEDGMRRIRQAVNQNLHKRASKLNGEGEEYGHMAQISGQVVDKPDKLRGDRTDRLIFEESGSNPYLLETYTVAEALVIINGVRLGTRILFGTGGDTEEGESKNKNKKSGLFGLEQIFLDPRSFSVLPYKHNYNNSGKYKETAYFLPSWRTVITAMDHRGVVDEAKAKKYYNDIRASKANKPDVLLRYCSEYCFTYEEALSRKGSNNFNQSKLAEQRTNIEYLKNTPTPTKGFLQWETEPGSDKRTGGVRFKPHPQGNIEVIEEPLKEDGNHIRNLYVGGIDSIDMGTSESIVGDKGSKFCIVIKKRSYGLGGNQYVCKYIDRPADVREAYENAAKMLVWYNCQANIEDTKVALKVYFREKGWIKLLMKRPKYALEGQSNNTQASNLIGTQASEKMINYGLDLVRDYIEDYYESICYLDMIMQLQDYSYEDKGRFDIVAAMQMCEIGDQDMMGITPRKVETYKWKGIGWYRNEQGYMVEGVLPEKESNNEHLFGIRTAGY